MIIRIWDFECTGLSAEDSDVIECGWADMQMPDQIISDPKSYLCGTKRPISPANRAVHHIMPSLLVGRDAFDADAFNYAAKEDGVTCLAAYNASFDSQWLHSNLPVICIYRAALRAYPEFESHSNMAVFYALEDAGRIQANYAHIASHRAGPDAYMSAHILRCILEDGHTGKELLAWSKEPPLLPRCPIGKHRGKPWAEVDTGWLRWALGSDLDDNIKWNCQQALDARATR